MFTLPVQNVFLGGGGTVSGLSVNDNHHQFLGGSREKVMIVFLSLLFT